MSRRLQSSSPNISRRKLRRRRNNHEIIVFGRCDARIMLLRFSPYFA
jgi:hypothetical protein